MSLTKTRGRRAREALLDHLAKVDRADRAVKRPPLALPSRPPLVVCGCRECGHRATIDAAKLPPLAAVSRKTLNRLKLRCCVCGSRTVDRVVAGSPEEARRFLAGAEIVDFARGGD